MHLLLNLMRNILTQTKSNNYKSFLILIIFQNKAKIFQPSHYDKISSIQFCSKITLSPILTSAIKILINLREKTSKFFYVIWKQFKMKIQTNSKKQCVRKDILLLEIFNKNYCKPRNYFTRLIGCDVFGEIMNEIEII
ncbi:hypothetical protein BpHYR1_022717 [Brachionus plicatilis]|uniref:Uncharacterized protein n=1 Tax=Brachionus plicatilis TaxID=10195 RepID=A0A3M7T705_BRAPC|nr:hypothetical protein BpHYR1_022717 [Brachionus plicatilis]